MSVHLPEPAIETHREFKEHVDRYWSKQKEVDNLSKLLYDKENPVLVPYPTEDRKFEPEIQRVGGSLAGWAIHRAAAFYPVLPKLSLEPFRTRHSQRDAENVTSVLAESIDQLQEAAGGKVWNDVVFDTLWLGRGCDIVLAGGPAYWFEFPFMGENESLEEWHERHHDWRARAPLPLLWRHLPAESTWPSTLSRLDDEAICFLTLTAWDLLHHFERSKTEGTAAFQGALDSKRIKRSDEITLSIYTDKEYISFAVLDERLGGYSGIPILSDRKGLLLQNYPHSQGSNPIRFVSGFTSSRKQPGRYWESMLFHTRSLLESLDSRMSEWATNSRRTGLAPWKMWLTSPFTEGSESDKRKFPEGGPWMFKMGSDGQKEDAIAAELPRQSETIPQLAQLTMQLFERITGLTAPLSGQGLTSVESAAQLRFASDLARELYFPVSASLTRHAKSIGERILEAAVAWNDDIVFQVHGEEGEKELTLTPEQAQGWRVRVTAKLEPQVLAAQTAQEGIGIQLLGMPPEVRRMDDAYLLEHYFRIEKPQEMIDRANVNAYERSPIVAEFIQRQAAIAAGAVLAQERAYSPEELQKIAAAGELPQGLEQELQRRGQVQGQPNTFFPPEATPQSIRQTGESSARGTIPVAPEGAV